MTVNHGSALDRKWAAATWSEGLAFFVGLFAVIGGEIWLAHAAGLFDRHFWLDEMYTYALVSDPSIGHSLQALASGVETHPPALYLMLRPVARLAGGASELVMRSFALGSVVLALVGMYLCLRTQFGIGPSILAIMAVWGHALVVTHAFDARFYGPWLASVVWYAYGLMRVGGATSLWGWRALIAFSALLCATLHYFGIIALVLVTMGEVYSRRQAGTSQMRGLAAAILGPGGLAACLPLLIGQRSSLTVASWLQPITFERGWGFLIEVLLVPTLSMAALAGWIWHREEFIALAAPKKLGGMTALLILPLVLIGISWAGQPVYWPRYALPAVIGLAPAAAWLVSGLARPWMLLLGVTLATWNCYVLNQSAHNWEVYSRSIDKLIVDLRRHTDAEPIMFESPAQLYVISHYAPDLEPRSGLIDFEIGHIGNVSQNRIFMRDLARQFGRFYPKPRVVPWTEISHLRRFFLVSANFGPGSPPIVLDSFYPGFRITRLGQELYQATAQQPP